MRFYEVGKVARLRGSKVQFSHIHIIHIGSVWNVESVVEGLSER